MADTCRHEWALGSDGCVNCGESWAALHPEDELASPRRRALNRLLAALPLAEVIHVGRPEAVMARLLGNEMPTPWLAVDLRETPDTPPRRFAIWKFTGDVYELDEHGAVGDEPVIKLYAEAKAMTEDELRPNWRQRVRRAAGLVWGFLIGVVVA